MSQKFVTWFKVMFLAFMLCSIIAVNAVAAVDGDDACVSGSVQEIDTCTYYYNQLDELEQRIYQCFIDSKEQFLNNEVICVTIDTYVSKNSINQDDYLQAVLRAKQAYANDDPEVWIWFQKSKLALQFFKDHVNLIVKQNPENGQHADFNSEEIRGAIETFEKKSEEFVATLYGTDKQKLEQIYDWLTTNVSYDHSYVLPNSCNAYGAIVNGKAVCCGYAYAYKYMADLAGLKVLYVTGYAGKEKAYHAWNLAYADGKWLLVDSCAGASSKLKEPKKKFFLVPITSDVYSLETKYFIYPQ